MSGSPSDRNSLEEQWRRRVEDAGLRLDFARNFVEEVQRDVAAHAVPAADGTFSYQRAVRAENVAAVEYGRVLRIYADLVVNGKPPDEGDWAAQAKTDWGQQSTPSEFTCSPVPCEKPLP
jgi:hypothetical protein